MRSTMIISPIRCLGLRGPYLNEDPRGLSQQVVMINVTDGDDQNAAIETTTLMAAWFVPQHQICPRQAAAPPVRLAKPGPPIKDGGRVLGTPK
jgi:hypothetical protein